VKVTDYYAPGPIASAFLESDAFVRGLTGPFGSGKSVACIMASLMCSAKQSKDRDGKRRSRGIIVRNTYPELKMTTIKTWQAWIPPSLGTWQASGPPTHYFNGPDGLDVEALFVALDNPDDISKLLSFEATWAWCNEAREIPKAIVDALTGRVGRFPARDDAAGVVCVDPQIVMDTNPPDTDHWYYALAERDTSTEFGLELVESTDRAEAELRRKGLLRPDQRLFEFFKQPGGRSAGAENLQNLRPGYYDFLIAGKTADFVKVYADGEYGFVKDGKPVFPEYIDSLHCKPFEIARGHPIRVGLDFGLTPAATISMRDLRGRWRVRSEVVTEDMGATKFAAILGRHLRERYAGHKVESIRGDPAGDQRSTLDDEQTVYDVLKVAGIEAEAAPTNDPIIRRDAVANLLNRLVDGEPALIVHPDCRVLRKGLAGGYCLRRLQVVGRDTYRDKPEKNRFSHVCEALEYDVVSGGEGRAVVRVERKQPRAAYAQTMDRVA
jgi:hypothetical protein